MFIDLIKHPNTRFHKKAILIDILALWNSTHGIEAMSVIGDGRNARCQKNKWNDFGSPVQYPPRFKVNG